MKEIIALKNVLDAAREIRQLNDKEYRRLLATIETIFVEEHEYSTWTEIKNFVLNIRR